MVMTAKKRSNSNRVLYTAFAAMMLILLVGFGALWRTYIMSNEQDEFVSLNNDAITELNFVQFNLSETVSAKRAFLLTKDLSYLNLYHEAQGEVWKHYEILQALIPTTNDQYEEIQDLKGLIQDKFENSDKLVKMAEEETLKTSEISHYFEQGHRQIVRVTELIEKLQEAQKERLGRREDRRNLYNNIFNWVLVFLAVASFSALFICAYLFRKTELYTMKEKEESDIRAHISTLALTMTDDLQLNEAGRMILDYFASNFGILASKIFLVRNNRPDLIASFGTKLEEEDNFKFDNSLLKKAMETGKLTIIDSIPENYWKIGSSLGDVTPQNILLLPFTFQGRTLGVIEMARFASYNEVELKALKELNETIGVGISAAYSRTQVQELLEETQQQAQELQAQQEELQASNEELEQQTRELEAQQDNLAIKNHDLEEAHTRLRERAEEIRRASQYKSEFLANMSHELRTPLNSLLILSSILAENKDKNLTTKQIEFANSIHNSGNDLLLLIDDILDLAKVEANKIKLNLVESDIHYFAKDLERFFEPQMTKKQIRWICDFDSKLKNKSFYSDTQRVGQILKNFISNAIKFTDKGSVTFKSELIEEDKIRFSVIDTGVGIPKDKQKLIFEAFEQVDGSISRKYGGTGLGLNISQKFAELLDGEIHVESEVGKGSSFSITLPIRLNKEVERSRTYLMAKKSDKEFSYSQGTKTLEAESVAKTIDEAELAVKGLSATDKTILIVEDDDDFRKSICDVVLEHGFKPIEASDGEVAMKILDQYIPSAVLLDIKIPGISGMGVLESIKKRSDLRHIPVHMISGVDYQQSALRMGALGYLTKPVSIEKIHSAIERIKNILSQNVRKVLFVEDDEAQQMAIEDLITDTDVEVIIASSGGKALEILENEVIDCVILDLNLPDITGLELLKRMNSLNASLPPVIIYTAKSLTPEEEAKLRQFSESIVLKSVRSVERLLNEVNLFIHRMESLLTEDKRVMLEKVRSYDSQFENKKILLVDDDLRNVFALTNALESKGFTVDIARNGLEAIETIDKNPYYDIVLMDIMMPEMDGYEAIRRIRGGKGQAKNIPIVALTAKAMKEDHENCIAAGANDYLAKPINLTNLMTVLKVWLPEQDFLQ